MGLCGHSLCAITVAGRQSRAASAARTCLFAFEVFIVSSFLYEQSRYWLRFRLLVWLMPAEPDVVSRGQSVPAADNKIAYSDVGIGLSHDGWTLLQRHQYNGVWGQRTPARIRGASHDRTGPDRAHAIALQIVQLHAAAGCACKRTQRPGVAAAAAAFQH